MSVKDIHRLADEDLMPLLDRREPAAFEVLYDRHGGAAFSLAYRIVGDRPKAEDITQEAFLSLWRRGDRYDRARGSVRAWLLGIVRNRAIDVLRRDVALAPSVSYEEHLTAAASPADTGVEALRREAAREVRSALAALPSDQLRVIELAYFGGLTHGEIAELLGMPLGTIKGRMRLGMEKIRAQLAEEV
jgi:RNA polymerase sigma-70 factor, ECF subfamily